MRKHALLLIALLCIAAPARSQNVDDIVAKYAQKIGGMSRVEAIQSVRRSGKFYGGGGFEAQVKNENKRPNKVREEFAFGGMVGVNAWDGKSGWKIEPWQGKKDAESLSEFEVELGDYKEVNGVFMPFGFAIGSKGSSSANKAQYAWERIEANVPLEDSKFAKPGAAAPTQPAVDLDASKQQPKAAEPLKPT